MATRYMEKGQDPPKATGSTFGLSENTDGALAVNQTGEGGVFSFLLPLKLVGITADTTFTAAKNGFVAVCNTTVSRTVTLPAAEPGLVFGVLTGIATTTGGHKLTPATGDTVVWDANAVSSAIVNTAGTDVVGDFLLVMGGDTANTWHIVGRLGTWTSAAA